MSFLEDFDPDEALIAEQEAELLRETDPLSPEEILEVQKETNREIRSE